MSEVPTKLIVYKGFGHGINKPKEQLARRCSTTGTGSTISLAGEKSTEARGW